MLTNLSLVNILLRVVVTASFVVLFFMNIYNPGKNRLQKHLFSIKEASDYLGGYVVEVSEMI